jgi:hypothetical protein
MTRKIAILFLLAVAAMMAGCDICPNGERLYECTWTPDGTSGSCCICGIDGALYWNDLPL